MGDAVAGAADPLAGAEAPLVGGGEPVAVGEPVAGGGDAGAPGWIVTRFMYTGTNAALFGEPEFGVAAIWSTTSRPDVTLPKIT